VREPRRRTHTLKRRTRKDTNGSFCRARPSGTELAARLRAMAAVDITRVVALTKKSATLEFRAHWARAAEIQAEAVAAAQALQQPDCVIVAHLQAAHANAVLGHAQTAGVPAARSVELLRYVFRELLPPAMASLEHRWAAGTLLSGACRPYEVAWCAATSAHANALGIKNLRNAAAGVPSAAAETSAWSAYVGHDAYMLTAQLVLELCALAFLHLSSVRMLSLSSEATAVAYSVFVERLRHVPAAHCGDVHD
jgi:hypothetical protein